MHFPSFHHESDNLDAAIAATCGLSSHKGASSSVIVMKSDQISAQAGPPARPEPPARATYMSLVA
jgi:hypothetical protein